MSLIGDLKRLLVFSPGLREPLLDELAANAIRLPIPDYESTVQERSYKTRLTELLNTAWFPRIARRPSISRIVEQALELRKQYEVEASQLLDAVRASDPFLAKRLLPKIRYRFGRLAYLGDLTELGKLAEVANSIPALKFQSAVARSISTGDVNEIMDYGVNAAQAVAQPLSMRTPKIILDRQMLNPVAQQALAVLRLNGLSVEGPQLGDDDQSQLLRFATSGVDRTIMKKGEPFLRELACLHGLSEAPRHQAILATAFHAAEEITFDAIEQEHQSS